MKKLKYIAVLLVITILFLMAACVASEGSGVDPTALPYTPEKVEEPSSESSEVVAGRPEEGLVVFQENCSECHDIADGVVIEGPSLFAAGARLDYEYVKKSILFPQEHITHVEGMTSSEETTMPVDFQQYMTAQQLEDVIAYVLSLEK